MDITEGLQELADQTMAAERNPRSVRYGASDLFALRPFVRRGSPEWSELTRLGDRLFAIEQSIVRRWGGLLGWAPFWS